MNRLLGKKSKKSHKSVQWNVSLGIPTNVAAGSVGIRAELDVKPKGGSRSYRDLEDQPDSTASPDENDNRASRIVFCDKESEGNGAPVPKISTSGAVVRGDGHGDGLTSECY